jgi:DNA processing protein
LKSKEHMDPKAYWVGFNLVKGIGAVRLRALLDFYGSLEIAWKAPLDGLRAAGLPPKALENFLRIRKDCSLEMIWENIHKRGIQVMTWEDDIYPRRLREIDQPPPVLYVLGSIQPQDDWSVAVVGTRRVTVYGRQVAEELSRFLASHGITVVSGLACGVDRIAHEGALEAGGRSIAVLGSGVDRIYPPEHTRLVERMAVQGAVMSDYPPGTPPESANFPPRNRIISGLAMATVVVEASEESGALITATFAVNQGREVFSVPGSIYAPQSKGTNRLIQDGATPLLKFEDILNVLEIGQVQEKQAARRMLQGEMGLSTVEAQLLRVIVDEPQHVDEICAQCGLPIEQVSATLTLMELKGMIRQFGGMNFSLVRENLADYRTSDNV